MMFEMRVPGSTATHARITVAIATVIVLTACTGAREATSSAASPTVVGPTTAPAAPEVRDYLSFTDSLTEQGYAIERGGRGGFPSRLIGLPGRGVLIEGDPVLTFEFPSKEAFDEMRSTIRPRGDMIDLAIINWDPPRFYGSGRLLVLYFGDKQRTIDALGSVLGRKFAGG
jgi:hypothetical protein